MGKKSKLANDLAIVCESRNAVRNPDGSIDIAAYARMAHRQRDAAVVSAVSNAAHSIRAFASAIWRALSRSLGRSLGWSGRTRMNAPLRS